MRWSQKGFARPEEIGDGKQLLLRIASMLTKLITRFDSSSSVVREAAQEEEFAHEEEDENENENKHVPRTNGF